MMLPTRPDRRACARGSTTCHIGLRSSTCHRGHGGRRHGRAAGAGAGHGVRVARPRRATPSRSGARSSCWRARTATPTATRCCCRRAAPSSSPTASPPSRCPGSPGRSPLPGAAAVVRSPARCGRARSPGRRRRAPRSPSSTPASPRAPRPQAPAAHATYVARVDQLGRRLQADRPADPRRARPGPAVVGRPVRRRDPDVDDGVAAIAPVASGASSFEAGCGLAQQRRRLQRDRGRRRRAGLPRRGLLRPLAEPPRDRGARRVRRRRGQWPRTSRHLVRPTADR